MDSGLGGFEVEAKHTPGPWKVFTAPQGHKIIGIGEVTGDGIADCGFGVWRGGDAEALANAQLMATAPDLLEALQTLVAQSWEPENQGGIVVPAWVLDRCTAAIAKATT